MIYYSHSINTQDGTSQGSKVLSEHIKGVLIKASTRFNNNLDIFFNKSELIELLSIVVKLHDIGKYTSYFQNYLLNKNPIDHILKQHSRIGGIIAYNFFKEGNKKLAITALYLIFQHHSKLIDIADIPSLLDENLLNIFSRQRDDIMDKLSQIESENSINNLEHLLEFPDVKELRRYILKWCKKDNNIKDYFYFNYLFSLLIESDKLDASDTSLYFPIRISSASVDARFEMSAFDINNIEFSKFSNDDLRNYCRSEVINNLNRPDILDNYIFTLTAPTGIGKTMTSLDFALKLKEKIRLNCGFESPIIYALPFINIIEQALNEYEKTLPNEVKIIAHYQFADVFGKSDDNEEQNYNQKLMSLDTWQSDVVITSFVQFFETLIGNRNKLLKKFNHYAGAIIILDEVQTLSLDQIPLIGATLFYLSKFLRSRIILMTATKPKIFDLAQKEILVKEKDEVKPLELFTNYQKVFECYQRTKIIPLLEYEFDKENKCEDFIDKIFFKKWHPLKSCLMVCNTVNRSIELYYAVINFLKEKNYKNKLFYLSTNVIPAHRFERIQNIKKLLENNLFPILVSTQVVEAGVDLDFDMGFRDIGPIDSIIQVAGRVNRNNDPVKLNSEIFIIDFNDCKNIYGSATYSQSKKAIQDREMFFEKDYLLLIEKYFENISEVPSFNTANKVFESMKALKYDSDSREDCAVSSFRIIKESKNTASVFIEIDKIATKVKEKFLNLIKKTISRVDFERYKKDFNQRIIAVPNYYLNSLKQESNTTLTENLMIVPKELVTKYYDCETGFIRNIEDEDKNKIVML